MAKNWFDLPEGEREDVLAAMRVDLKEWVYDTRRKLAPADLAEARVRARGWKLAIRLLTHGPQERRSGAAGAPAARAPRKPDHGAARALPMPTVKWLAVHERTGRPPAFRGVARISVCLNARRSKKKVQKRAADCLNCERGLGIIHNPRPRRGY